MLVTRWQPVFLVVGAIEILNFIIIMLMMMIMMMICTRSDCVFMCCVTLTA